jgi:hypothetical protein
MGVTAEINALLAVVVKRNKRKGVDLHLLHTPQGMLLAWAHCDDGVSGEDKPSAIRKAFGLR